MAAASQCLRRIASVLGVCSFLLGLTCNRTSAATSTFGNWSITQKGRIVEVAYGGGSHFPQYAALHLDSSYFRMNYGPDSGWGTSVILLPAFWTGGTYHQGAPIKATWKSGGADLLISFAGAVSALSIQGQIRLTPPKHNSISATVSISKVTGDVKLDERSGEAFKPVMLSSMHVSDEKWDAQSAYVGGRSFAIPADGWICPKPVEGKVFGLKGGSSKWKKNAPTIEVALPEKRPVTGWVTGADDPNSENVGYWAASDRILRSWQYVIVAKPR